MSLNPRMPYEIVDQWAKVCKQYPMLVDWLEEQKQSSLEKLPLMRENVAFAQGQCAMLIEILNIIKSAPDTAAKFK